MVQHNNQVDAHLCHPKITFWLISQKLLNGSKPSMARFNHQVDAHLFHELFMVQHNNQVDAHLCH